MNGFLQEQERLIAGYGEANRSAAVQVKDLETRLKAKDAAMVEERAALERDLVRAVEAQKHRSADTADKLRCAMLTCVQGICNKLVESFSIPQTFVHGVTCLTWAIQWF